MLSKPEAGWTTVTIGTFSDRASYLKDVSVDCLKSMIYALRNPSSPSSPFYVCFDAEGWEYTVVSDWYRTNIIVDKDEIELLTVPIDILSLALELVADIALHLDEWEKWDCPDGDRNRRDMLVSLCDDLLCEIEDCSRA